jgi:hypothetical protein
MRPILTLLFLVTALDSMAAESSTRRTSKHFLQSAPPWVRVLYYGVQHRWDSPVERRVEDYTLPNGLDANLEDDGFIVFNPDSAIISESEMDLMLDLVDRHGRASQSLDAQRFAYFLSRSTRYLCKNGEYYERGWFFDYPITEKESIMECKVLDQIPSDIRDGKTIVVNTLVVDCLRRLTDRAEEITAQHGDSYFLTQAPLKPHQDRFGNYPGYNFQFLLVKSLRIKNMPPHFFQISSTQEDHLVCNHEFDSWHLEDNSKIENIEARFLCKTGWGCLIDQRDRNGKALLHSHTGWKVAITTKELAQRTVLIMRIHIEE